MTNGILRGPEYDLDLTLCDEFDNIGDTIPAFESNSQRIQRGNARIMNQILVEAHRERVFDRRMLRSLTRFV